MNLSNDLNQIIENNLLDQKPTNPLLLRINEIEYDHSDIKVMIIGKETNDWGNNFTGDIQEILEIYDDFFNSGFALNSYKGHFWNGFKRFNTLLQAKYKDKKISYLWNNVIKIGASGRGQNHPQNYIYEVEQTHFNLLEKELEILNPDIVLFLSGPTYDDKITRILPGVKFQSCNTNFTCRQLSRLIFKSHKNIFRTYHPNYLWRNDINKYFGAVINSVEV